MNTKQTEIRDSTGNVLRPGMYGYETALAAHDCKALAKQRASDKVAAVTDSGKAPNGDINAIHQLVKKARIAFEGKFTSRKNSIGAEVIGRGEVVFTALTSEQTGFGGDKWKHEKAIALARGTAKHLNRIVANHGYDKAIDYCVEHLGFNPKA